MKTFIVGLLAIPLLPIWVVGVLIWLFVIAIQSLGEDILESIKRDEK